jgi:hypothetical protein
VPLCLFCWNGILWCFWSPERSSQWCPLFLLVMVLYRCDAQFLPLCCVLRHISMSKLVLGVPKTLKLSYGWRFTCTEVMFTYVKTAEKQNLIMFSILHYAATKRMILNAPVRWLWPQDRPNNYNVSFHPVFAGRPPSKCIHVCFLVSLTTAYVSSNASIIMCDKEQRSWKQSSPVLRQ